jgi:hypothetical protein
VIDGDVSSIVKVGDSLAVGGKIGQLNVADFTVALGPHSLSWYAVNDIGFVSDPYVADVTVIFLTPPAPPSDESSTTGKIAGGVVGGFLGLLAIAAIVLYFLHRRWKSGAQEEVKMDYTVDSEFKEESLEEAIQALDQDDLDIYFSQPANFGVDLPFSARFDEAEQEAFVHLYQNF